MEKKQIRKMIVIGTSLQKRAIWWRRDVFRAKLNTRVFNFARRTALRRQVAHFWSDVSIHTRFLNVKTCILTCVKGRCLLTLNPLWLTKFEQAPTQIWSIRNSWSRGRKMLPTIMLGTAFLVFCSNFKFLKF